MKDFLNGLKEVLLVIGKLLLYPLCIIAVIAVGLLIVFLWSMFMAYFENVVYAVILGGLALFSIIVVAVLIIEIIKDS